MDEKAVDARLQMHKNLHAVMAENGAASANYLKPWLEKNAQTLASMGGWNIPFNLPIPPIIPCPTLELKGKEVHAPVVVLDNVIPAAWCREFINKHETIGFTSVWDLDRMQYKFVYEGQEETQLNTSEQITFISPDLANFLWNRLSEYVPNEITLKRGVHFKGTTWSKVGCIPVCRFLRYKAGQFFKHHYDPTRYLEEFNGTPGTYVSLITLALYLNDCSEFVGGGLNFLEVEPLPKLHFISLGSVEPKVGRVALFLHDELHEGGQLTEGTKYMMQVDILYRLEKAL